jgi:hypothetical protein
MFQTKIEWARTLKIGDKVMTDFPDVRQGLREATIEDIVFGASCQTGVMVKLKEQDRAIDLSWIEKHWKELRSLNTETSNLSQV